MKHFFKQLKSAYIRFPLVARRFYLIFLVVVILFLILIIRLANMQLANQNFYLQKLRATTTYTVTTATERGKIYDANGIALVQNTSKKVLTFTRSNSTSAKDIKALAQKLANFVDLKETNVSLRDKIDYYLATPENYNNIVKKLSFKKKYDKFGNNLSSSEIYRNAVAAVKKSDVDFDQQTLKIVYIFNQMNSTATFDTTRLTTGDLSNEQMATITKERAHLPGITISEGWQRQDSDSSLSPLLGRITSERAGLPQEDAKEYLKKGYSLNDRVGTSYLEKQYESVLQGKKRKKVITVNRQGQVIEDRTESNGSKGDNIKLTINSNFQTGVENILKRYYQSEIASGNAMLSDGVYAVAINPKTGAILSMAGLSHEKGSATTQNDILGTVNEVFTPGSVVKGGTLTAGWETGAITGNQTLNDMPIVFAGDSTSINSWFTKGIMPITAVQALEYSSNTYMVQVALNMMGQKYYYGLPLTNKGYKKAMEELRKTYAEYGLGTATGIDLPNVSEGYKPKNFSVSNTLTEAFGQFDNYNTLQLAQYAATVSNNGSRMSAHLVEGIYDNNSDDGLGKSIKTTKIEKINQVNISPEQMSIIKQGFYNVVNSNSSLATGNDLRGRATIISGKTGTAETFSTNLNGQAVKTVNLNVVAYDQNNQIAVGVMYPNSLNYLAKAHQYIARDIIDLYVSNYAQ